MKKKNEKSEEKEKCWRERKRRKGKAREKKNRIEDRRP